MGYKENLELASNEVVSILSQYVPLNIQGLEDPDLKFKDKYLGEIQKKRVTFFQKPDDQTAQANLLNAVKDGYGFITSHDQLKNKFLSRLPQIQQTIYNSSIWHNYNPSGSQSSYDKSGKVKASQPNVSLVDSPFPNDTFKWIKIIEFPLNLNPKYKGFDNPFYIKLKNNLKNNIIINSDSILLKGTKESWYSFISIAKFYIADIEKFNNLDIIKNLPTDTTVKKENLTSGAKQFTVDTQGNNIFVQFDTEKPYYIKDIGDIIQYIRDLDVPISFYRINYDSGLLTIIAPTKKSDISKIATKFYILSNKLKDPQGLNYVSKPLNEAIVKVFGISMKESQEDSRNEAKSQAISDITVAGLLKKNVLAEPALSNRFTGLSGTFQEKIAQVYGPKSEFNPKLPYGPNNWAGLFGPTTTPLQNKVQSEGVEFLNSRQVSVIADQPGFGKTAQAITSADSVRNDGQKILVVTPNNLLKENWIGEEAKGPMYFCGHDRSQIAVIESKEDLDKAINDPNIIWVVIRDVTLNKTTDSKDIDDMANAIGEYSEKKVFSSLVIDEIQSYRDVEGLGFKRLQKAITWDGIPFRIGISGTPADNSPADIYAQLRLLRHRVIRDGKGDKGGYSQNEDGFAEQFLGGADLSKIVALSRDKKDTELSEDWKNKCYSVLQWTQGLSEKKKHNILDMFSSIFIRREKKDIKDIPLNDTAKIVCNKEPILTKEQRESKDWKSAASFESAMQKADSTVEKAVALLQEKPTRQIFIASKFVKVTKKIADGINAKMGEGSCFAITGEISDLEKRDYYVKKFKSFSKANNNPNPIRCLVYTLDTGAVGLNFSNCDTGIINDVDDNPSVNLQAQERVHRIDSKEPVTVYYTQFDDSINSLAAKYDRASFARIQQKKKINHEICNLMKKVKTIKSNKDKIQLTNEFVSNVIKNIVIDLGLDSLSSDFFLRNINKAINGEEIEPLEMINVNQEILNFNKKDNKLLPFLPNDIKDNIYNSKTKNEVKERIEEAEVWMKDVSSKIKDMKEDIEELNENQISKLIQKINSPEFIIREKIKLKKKSYEFQNPGRKADENIDDFKDWLSDEDPEFYKIFTKQASNWYRMIKIIHG